MKPGSPPMKAYCIALALALAASLCGCGGGEDPAALMASAKRYLQQRDFSASIIQLKNLLQKNPDNGEARYLLSVALLEQGDAVSAQIELEGRFEGATGLPGPCALEVRRPDQGAQLGVCFWRRQHR
ncbi:MAG: tetratricopeptide repeat protein [Burkholderiales bacterium]